MAIGLTAQQRRELSAMSANVDESVAALKRLIADAKDRTRALAKLSEAEEAQKRHAREVGIPFNEAAFTARRAELDALPQTLTVEDGQLAAFSSLQRAIAVILEGPYVRSGRGGAKRKRGRSAAGGGKGESARSPKAAPKRASSAAKKASSPNLKLARGGKQDGAGIAPLASALPAPMKRIKPLPLALGS